MTPLLRRWWWLLVVGALAAGLAGYVAAARIPPTYEARATLLTGPVNTDFDTVRAAAQLAQTYAELATTRPVLERAAGAAGSRRTADELMPKTSATASDATRLVRIRVRDDDAALAARLANAIADELVVRSRANGRQLEGRLELVDPAEPAAEPIAPQVSLMTGLAGVAGLAIALILMFVLDRLRGIESESDLAETADGARFLGTVTARALPPDDDAEVAQPRFGRALEDFGLLAAKAGLADGDPGLRVLAVAGADRSDGSGLVAGGLAHVLSRNGTEVVLVDANSTAEVSRLFRLEDEAGFTDLGNGFKPEDALAAARGNLSVLPFGRRTAPREEAPMPPERLVGLLKERADLVVVHTPPLARSAEALAWARASDGTLLVVSQGRTSRQALAEARDSSSLLGVKLVGTVLTRRGRRPRR